MFLSTSLSGRGPSMSSLHAGVCLRSGRPGVDGSSRRGAGAVVADCGAGAGLAAVEPALTDGDVAVAAGADGLGAGVATSVSSPGRTK